MERPIVYEPHPVSCERKAELLAEGFRIVDAKYRPPEAEDVPPEEGRFVGLAGSGKCVMPI